MDNLNKESFEEQSDLLSSLKKGHAGFDLPKDYFSRMQASVLEQVIEETEAPVFSGWDRINQVLKGIIQPQYALLAVAATVLVVIAVGIKNSSSVIKPSEAWSSLSVEDYEYYFDSNIEEYNNQEIMAVLSEDELIDQNAITPISTIEIPDVIVDEYIDGLDNENLLEFQSIDE